jgi:hypothetical protein
MPARSGKLVAAAIAALLLMGAFSACGGTGVGQVEDKVGSELKAQLQRQSRRTDIEEPTTTISVDRVDCPDDVDTQTGSMFRCRALDAKGRVVGTVTVQMRGGGDPAWQFIAAAPS